MTQTLSLHENWSTSRKITFRFISVFFFFQVFPFPIYLIPELGITITQPYYDLWNILDQWAINIFFGLEDHTVAFSGSGDRIMDWAHLYMILLLTVIIGTIWSILDRKRKSYAKLWRWTHLFIVYQLVMILCSYGFSKALGEQFGNIGIGGMLETYGESSPMRMLWTFMSASEPYEQFSGWSEVIPGILLLFRRTRTLGALAAAGVMLNVFVLNMTYDVPVKLFSFTLMVQALYIALADRERLMALFIRNKPLPALDWPPFFKTPWKNYTLLSVQVLTMGYVLYAQIDLSLMYEIDPDRPRPALYGIHDVNQFVINGDTLPPLTTDTIRWSKAFMDFPVSGGNLNFAYKDMNNRSNYLIAEIDTIKQELMLKPYRDTVNVYTFKYEWIDSNLTLDGVFKGDTLHITTTYFDPDNFILKSRGFNWINEVPYNTGVSYK